ncbi:MAG: hypothetical protein A2V66_01065 [Ignavibacteria bacterium RBG_13_36_8]|nr:MAG: hypothetical protein A2V66_01065 [Ignavibacteria bacterium RBG_13_36_8]
MRMKIFFTVILITGLVLISCKEEPFSPKTDFVERLILTCLIDCESDFQSATLTSSYTVDGFNPLENALDPSIEGADIRIWYEDTVYTLRDTTTTREDTSRYFSPEKFYYVKSFRPQGNKLLEIEAVLPDGRKLVSSTITPSPQSFFFGDGDQIIPPSNGALILNDFNVYWTFIGDGEGLLFVPRLFIIYTKLENGVQIEYTKEVPQDYIQQGEEFLPLFPVGTKRNLVKYKTSAIDRVMTEISEGDPNKQNYTIKYALIQLFVLDKNLSAYYGALQLVSDGFSVKVDASEYTNIEGGRGVFGSFLQRTYEIYILDDYILSFGYKIF